MFLLSRDALPRLRGAYLILLFGAITTPLLPFWQGGIRALASIIALSAIGERRKIQLALGLLMAVSGIISVGGWSASLVQSPSSHIVHALTDVFGQPVGLLPSLAVLCLDLVTITALAFALSSRNSDAFARVFTSCLVAFWLLSLASTMPVIAGGFKVNTAAKTLTALSGWTTWIYWAFLGLLLFRSDRQKQQALKVIAGAALLVGAIVIAQWVSSDYSYYLGSGDGNSSPFFRVRGTDYYHTPTALVTALGAIASIGMMPVQIRFWPALSMCILVGVTAMNNTRAISISLITGLAVLISLHAAQRRWRLATLALLAVLIMMPNVLYLKPQARVQNVHMPATGRIGITARGEAKQASVDNLIKDNTPRSSLARSGIALLPNHLIVGTGPGILDLPLEGNIFGGITSTYSTHILFLDLLLMSGGAGFMFCILAFSASLIGGLRAVLIRKPGRLAANPALLAMLTSFSIASLFLPQERNELIGLAFACAGLVLSKQEHSLDHKSNRDRTSLPKSYLAILTLLACGWAIATSPAYVFPAVEFVGRHGAEAIKKRQTIYVTDQALKAVLQSLMVIRGGESARVKLLSDGIGTLNYDSAWILWSPMGEHRYRELIAELERRKYPRQMYPLGISTPSHWWVVESAQPTVTFLFTGPRDAFSTGKKVSPNIAPFGSVRVSANVRGEPRSVADSNFETAVTWPAEETSVIEFGTQTRHFPRRVIIYQLNGLYRRSAPMSSHYSWRLEGEHEHGKWILIDQVINFPLSHEPSSPSRFSVKTDRDFDKYRFVFTRPKVYESGSSLGLSEVQLHVAQAGTASPIE